MKKEQGLPIQVDSGCFIGTHVFPYLGAYSGSDEIRLLGPEPTQRCKCGLYSWEEIHKEVEEVED